MNKCCRDAKNYLKNVEEYDVKYIESFIDDFNRKLKIYSINGLSSYLLNCIELCLKLSKSIKYLKGEVYTKWIKGNVLFLGGRYTFACRCYTYVLNNINKDDSVYNEIVKDHIVNLIHKGDLESALDIMKRLIEEDSSISLEYPVALILLLRGEKELTTMVISNSSNLSVYDYLVILYNSIKYGDINDAEKNIKILKDSLTLSNSFIDGYLESIEILLDSKFSRNISEERVQMVINRLNGRNSFFHFIDGLLNISEVYINLGDLEKGQRLLNQISKIKNELTILDTRIMQLSELLAIKCEDYKNAFEFRQCYDNLLKEYKTFEIDKSLREISPYLYNRELIIS